MNEVMETAVVTTKGQVVIPAKLRRKLGIKPGTRLMFDEKNSQMIVRPITEAYIGSLQGILSDKDGDSWTGELVWEHIEEVEQEK